MSKATFDFHCLDCGVNTGAIGEYYMLHDAVWKRINPKGKGMLCIGCAEKRLGRMLTPDDFAPVDANKIDNQSTRLLSRMRGQR